MAEVSVSYRALSQASSNARKEANRITDYHNAMMRTVYNKLNSYSGDHNGNISNASSSVRNKLTTLVNRKNSFERIRDSLNNIKTECKNVDKAVARRIASLTGTFKRAHGIKDSWIERAYQRFIVSWENRSALGRWIGDKRKKFENAKDQLLGAIKKWYHFDGGKERVAAIAKIAFDFCLLVISVVGIIVGAVTGLALVFAIGTALIAILNIATDIVEESKAFGMYDTDPAEARRLHRISSFTDFLRKETNSNVSLWRKIATGLDIMDTVCSVGSFLLGVGDLLKKGFKWATNLSDVKFKDMVKPKNIAALVKKVFKTGWDGLKTGMKNIRVAIKTRDLSFVKDVIGKFKGNFARNFKKTFFGEFDKTLSAKDGLTAWSKSLKNRASFLNNIRKLVINDRAFYEKDSRLKDIRESLIGLSKNTILPAIVIHQSGQVQIDMGTLNFGTYSYEHEFTLKDFEVYDYKKNFDSIVKTYKKVTASPLQIKLPEKIAQPIDIKISPISVNMVDIKPVQINGSITGSLKGVGLNSNVQIPAVNIDIPSFDLNGLGIDIPRINVNTAVGTKVKLPQAIDLSVLQTFGNYAAFSLPDLDLGYIALSGGDAA